MRGGISLTPTARDRDRLEALVADGDTPRKHVWRARTVLLSAEGHGTHTIMRDARTAVWRWQGRFMQERVVALTHCEPPGEVSHRTASAMAQAAGISLSSVQRIGRGHGLQPHRVRILPQSLGVRPILAGAGAETCRYEAPTGGRRFRALKRLVQQDGLAADAPVP